MTMHRWTTVGALLLGLVAGACSESDSNPIADDTTTTQGSLVPSRQPAELAAACDDYDAAFASWSSSAGGSNADEAFADDLDRISVGSAAGTALVPHLREMAAEFRAGQLNIDTGAVGYLCAGNEPVAPTGDEAAARAAFIAQVRDEAPALSAIADDDLLAGGDEVCSVLDVGLNESDPARQYMLLTSIAYGVMGNHNEDDTAPVIRAAGDHLCQQHSAKITSILAAS